MALRVALFGSGIFATTNHAPVFQHSPESFECVGVWSRTFANAQALATTLRTEPYSGDQGAAELLAREDVQAVVVCLPLDVQPTYVRMAMAAGKHVLSEKPIASTVAAAQALLDEYHADFKPAGLWWSVAENYRYEPGFQQAAQLGAVAIGTPVLLELAVHSPMNKENKYYHTEWRREPSWRGGFFQDGAVHFVAAMRMLAGSDPVAVTASTSHRAPHLPGPDTLAAVVWFESGVQGVVNISFAVPNRKFELSITGTAGKVQVVRGVDGEGRHGYAVHHATYEPEADIKAIESTSVVHPFAGVPSEFAAFATAVAAEPEERANVDANGAEEALMDLAFIEACIQSGDNGGQVVQLSY